MNINPLSLIALIIALISLSITIKSLLSLINWKKKSEPTNISGEEYLPYWLEGKEPSVEKIEKQSIDDERFKDIIEAQIDIQEAINLINTKDSLFTAKSLQNKIDIDKAERFLSTVIKAKEEYKKS